MAEHFLHIALDERRPVLVAGDFNLPDRGFLYRMFRRNMVDAHKARGRGYGYTFPGDTKNPLTLFRPWLRLDYVFAGFEWKILRCRTEPSRRSQHRAVAVRLSFVGDAGEAKRERF